MPASLQSRFPIYSPMIAPLLYLYSLPLPLNLMATYNRVTTKKGTENLYLWCMGHLHLRDGCVPPPHSCNPNEVYRSVTNKQTNKIKEQIPGFDVHESVHRHTIMKVTNKMQLYRLIYYS
jgi:hypothetical protein